MLHQDDFFVVCPRSRVDGRILLEWNAFVAHNTFESDGPSKGEKIWLAQSYHIGVCTQSRGHIFGTRSRPSVLVF